MGWEERRSNRRSNKDQNSSPLFLKVIINILEGKQTAQPYFKSIHICLKTKMRVCGCPKIVITSDRGARDKRKTKTTRKRIGKREKNSSLSRLSSHISIFGLVFFKLKSQSRKLCSFVFKALGPCESL